MTATQPPPESQADLVPRPDPEPQADLVPQPVPEPQAEEQLPLIPVPIRRPRRLRPPAPELPVARVALMTPVPHLDRPFDYEVPATLDATALPGVRVRVRFAGRLVDGFVLERVASSDRALQPLRSVHGPPVLTPEVAALCHEVADRYAGTFGDVVRFAIPPRHARAEARFPGVASADRQGLGVGHGAAGARAVAGGSAWRRYRGGAELLTGVAGTPAVRALWISGPGEDTPARIADLVVAAVARGRGAIVVVPDAAGVDAAATALDEQVGVPAVRLEAELGPQARYAAFLQILSGAAPVVVGTRSAVFAPVVDLGLIVVWNDGDDSLAEVQAPGWHAREVAALRAAAEDVSLVVAGPSVTLESARMASAGWLVPVAMSRSVLRAAMPRVQVAADVAHSDPAGSGARIPLVALELLRAGVEHGPVLVSVPRAGYLPGLACQACRERARCPQCGTPLRAEGPGVAGCPTHGEVPEWTCPFCGGTQLRATVVGVRRTAEEFGRALPGVRVLTSSGERPLRSLARLSRSDGTTTAPRGPLVVATPGVEPDPGPEGYAGLLLLDTAAALSRPGLRVAEEALRRWFHAAALVRPAGAGGRVLMVADPGVREVQALVRWDPMGYAERELVERRSLALPPAVRVAQLVGPGLAVGELVDGLCDELGPRVLRRSGPLPLAASRTGAAARSELTSSAHVDDPIDPEQLSEADSVAWLVAVSMADGHLLTGAIRRAQVLRSSRRAPVVTVRMDPVHLRTGT